MRYDFHQLHGNNLQFQSTWLGSCQLRGGERWHMGNQIQFIQKTIIAHCSHAALTSTVPNENENATHLASYQIY